MDDEERERELPEFDGTRPQEEVSAEECEAPPKRCEVPPQQMAGGGIEESEFSADEEIHESFPIEPIPVIQGADGLPKIVTPDYEDALAVPFCYETQLCIEDAREYVEIFGQELAAHGWTVDVDDEEEADLSEPAEWLSPQGDPVDIDVLSKYDSEGSERPRRTFKPHEVELRWGVHLTRGAPGFWLPVRPRRERCKHYRRQVFSNDNQPDPAQPMHQIVFRVCAARRSNGGAYMSLRDEAVYACDFRDPPDPRSSRLQDDKDRKKLEERPDLLLLPLFNMDGESVQLERKTDEYDQHLTADDDAR